jgi:hypothetical protein
VERRQEKDDCIDALVKKLKKRRERELAAAELAKLREQQLLAELAAMKQVFSFTVALGWLCVHVGSCLLKQCVYVPLSHTHIFLHGVWDHGCSCTKTE